MRNFITKICPIRFKYKDSVYIVRPSVLYKIKKVEYINRIEEKDFDNVDVIKISRLPNNNTSAKFVDDPITKTLILSMITKDNSSIFNIHKGKIFS